MNLKNNGCNYFIVVFLFMMITVFPMNRCVAKEKNISVGSSITFGSYPQGKKGEVRPIEWIVLDRDGSNLLVISRYGLENHCFDANCSDWENSELRRWLNNEFFEKAFSDTDRARISPCGDDKVFLLSEGEAIRVFNSDKDRECRPTDYALECGAYEYNGNCCWWLRSSRGNNAACVYTKGFIDWSYVSTPNACVRPVIKLNMFE